jgi:ComF family protein
MAAVRYNDCARSLLLPFKHGDGTHLAKFMAGLMYGRCRGIVDEADLVAPVPIHFTRLAKRRYNQAALLARFIGRLGGKPVCYGLLARKRMTESQGHMSPEERKRNVAGAFEAKTGFSAGRPRIAGATVLLVDDVMTTGATVQECSRVLKKAGAKAVLVLTFAKV